MLHQIVFAKAALDASGGNVQLVGIADEKFPLSNANAVRINDNHNLIAGFCGGVGLANARLNAGSLRNAGYPLLVPTNNATLPGNDANFFDFRDYPLRLKGQEDVKCEITNGAANDAVVVGIVATPDHQFTLPAGAWRWIRFTANPTEKAYDFSNVAAITLDDTLEGGNYQVAGLQYYGATTIMARLVFNNDDYRPGCIAFTTNVQRGHPMFGGQLGVWGTFNQYTPPQVQTFGSTAGAVAGVGRMLVRKVA